jgi:hypothetical protein
VSKTSLRRIGIPWSGLRVRFRSAASARDLDRVLVEGDQRRGREIEFVTEFAAAGGRGASNPA